MVDTQDVVQQIAEGQVAILIPDVGERHVRHQPQVGACLLYTSDAADEFRTV
ncbi:MAG: hypothetical protein QUU85_14825 [Candidatus Eisenbacteria bacterium]|nr:hypothetical protein [Candidatus Eisenbacteria bacterium]